MGIGLVIGIICLLILLPLFLGSTAMNGFATAYWMAAVKTQNRLLRFLAGAGGAVAGAVGAVVFIVVSMLIMVWSDGCKAAAFRKKETSSAAEAKARHTSPREWQLSRGRTVRLEISGDLRRLVDESGSTIHKLGSAEAIDAAIVSDQRTCLLLLIHVFKLRPSAPSAWEYDHLLRVVLDASGRWRVSRVLQSPAPQWPMERPIVLALDSVSADGFNARIRVSENGSTRGPHEWQTRSLDDPIFAENRHRR